MGIVNFAQGSLYMLGAYIGLTILSKTNNFYIAIILSPLIIGLVGGMIERFTIKRLYKKGHLYQLLLTFGYVLSLGHLVQVIWGTGGHSIQPPGILMGSITILGEPYPVYRLSVLFFSTGILFLLWCFLERTKLGSIVRAGTNDSEMVSAMGINISLVFTLVFALGSWLAGLGGMVAAPIFTVKPGMDSEIIIDIFIAVVIGGLGSFGGSVLGGFLIGMSKTFVNAYIPNFGMVVIYAVMALVLLARPYGILGRKEFKI
jgi:branched-subunit amino acid ABC-type transport system permease component